MSFLVGAVIMTTVFIGATVAIAEASCFYRKFKDFNKKFIERGSGSYGQVAKLDWATIKKIYFVNKSRWRYERIVSKDNRWFSENPCLLYNTGDKWIPETGRDKKVQPYRNKDEIVRVQLSFSDYIKFMWAKKFAKSKDIGSEMILASAQEDIEALRNQAMEQIHEAQKQMAQIVSKENTGPKLELFTGEQ